MRPEGFPEIQPHSEFDTDEARQEILGRVLAADAKYGDALLEQPGASRHEEHEDGSDDYWVESEKVSPLARLTSTHGPFVEVAGPSNGRFSLVDTSALPRPLVTTNISEAVYSTDPLGQPIRESVDVKADGRQMPFRPGQVGAVFVRCFGRLRHQDPEVNAENYREFIDRTEADRGRAIEEAARLLEPGGLLIWEGGRRANVSYARALGLRPIMMHRRTDPNIQAAFQQDFYPGNKFRGGETWSVVMEKPVDQSADTDRPSA